MDAIWLPEFTHNQEILAAHFRFAAADLAANRAGKMSAVQKKRATLNAVSASLFCAAWTFLGVMLSILMVSLGLAEEWGTGEWLGILLVGLLMGWLELGFIKTIWRFVKAIRAGSAKVVMGKVSFVFIQNTILDIPYYPFCVQFLVIRDKRFIIRPVTENMFIQGALYKVYYSPQDPKRLLSLELVYLR